MTVEEALSVLQTKIGEETHVSDWVTVTQEMINTFAAATGDHQWIHVDVERANAESPFGGPIAHGYLTLSMIPYLTGSVDADKPRFPGVRMGVNYGVNKVRFPSPVPVNSSVRSRSRLLEAAPAKGGLQIVSQITVEVKGQEKPACVAETVTLLVY